MLVSKPKILTSLRLIGEIGVVNLQGDKQGKLKIHSLMRLRDIQLTILMTFIGYLT
jgi:hypothetical protein